jgi:mRNA interferase RelE/StbE
VAQVFVTRTAREALAALDHLRADAVLDAHVELERDPRLGHELRERLAGLRSYRIIHELRDHRTARVVAFRHRGNAYETDPR